MQRRLRLIGLVLLVGISMTLASCASGWRSCREWTNLAAKDASSGNPGDVIPGVIYLAISPIACGTALVLSPITHMTDRREEPESKLATPTPVQDEATPTPVPAD
jgi:hypothetical protein